MAQKPRLFELEGLKFEIGKLRIEVPAGDDGEKHIKDALAENLGHALAPVAQAMRVQLPAATTQAANAVVAVTEEGSRKARRPGRARGAGSAAPSAAAALAWKPNFAKYGHPNPEWSNGTKAMWLLDAYSKEHGTGSAPQGQTIPVLVATFNKHFPHAKPITSSHVYRDFGRYASANPPKVTSDHNQTPPVWYVAAAGTAAVEDLLKSGATPLPFKAAE
jgi:hypothetical protein